MVILSDLSDVLIKGIYGTEEIIAERYGVEVAKRYQERRLEVNEDFRELLRGGIGEDDYWRLFMHERIWPFDIQEVKAIFSENLKKTVPETLKVYERIVAFPDSLRDPDGMAISGMPEIYIVSDHIAERIEEIYAYHPGVFAVTSKEFWSCDIGKIKMDDGFFPQLLRALDLSTDEVIFVDDDAYNTTAASLDGITSIRFESADQLEESLSEYGFCFAPKIP